MAPELSVTNYKEKEVLDLPTLERRIRVDMIPTYKFLGGQDDINIEPIL